MNKIFTLIILFAAFQIKSQTTITWTGNQDSLWNNSLNWSPTQVPNTSNHVVIPSTSIAPQVNVSATILNLTVNSSATIKINSLLKVRGNLSLSNCNVLGNNVLRADSVASVSLSARLINITNATVSVAISLTGSTINLNGNTFNQKIDIKRYNMFSWSFGSSSNGGNTFNQKFSFINKAKSQTRFGVTNPDIFNDSVDVKNFSNYFIMAYSSQGNEFKKNVSFYLSILQDPISAIYVGDQASSSAKFFDNINYTSLHNGIVFLPVLRLGSNVSGWIELAENKTIVTGNTPMIELQLTKFKKLGSDSFSINNNNLSVLVSNRSVFEGPVNWTLNSIRLNGGYFNKNVTIFSNSNRSFPNNISQGNNYFKENFEINRSTSHFYSLANTNPDTCLGNYTLNSSIFQFGGYNAFVNSSGNIIHGNLIVNNVSCNFSVNQNASLKILGNLIATNQNFNWSFVGITFGNSNGYTELDGNITINNGNPSSSFISFKNFRKKNTNSVTFTNHNGPSWSPIRIENCPEWRGDLTINGLGAVLNSNTFYGKVKVDLNKVISSSNNSITNAGGNTFHQTVTLKNSITGFFPITTWTWASTLTDTYLDTLFIEKSNSSNLNFVTNGQAILKSSLVVNDLSSNKIKFAEGTGKITFSGDNNQTITATNNKSIQIKNLEINKENNFVSANDSLLINGNLALINGVIKSPNVTKPLEIRQNCTVTGGNSFSYVDGYVLNRQNSIKYFPVGHNNRFMPVYSDSVNAALQLKVRYRNENSNLVNVHSNRGSFTDSISTKEYWEVLQNNNPNSTINLNLAFDTLGLCNLQPPAVINFAQTQSAVWNKVSKSNVSNFNNHKVLVKGTFNNVATSLVSFVKPNAWCNDSTAYSSTISLNSLEDIALFSANMLNANTDISVDGNVGVNNQYTANYYPINGTFDFNNSTTTALSTQLTNLVNTIEALPKFSLYNLNGQVLQARNYILNGNQILNDTLLFNGDSLGYAIVKIIGKLTINSTAQIRSNEIKIRNIIFLADTIVLNTDAKINGIFISKYYTEIHPLDESQFAAYSLNRVNIVGFTGNNRINFTKPTRMKNINRTRNHFVYEPCSDCNLICDGDFESAVVNDEGRVEKLTTYSPCWTANGGFNTPDYFNIDLTGGDCTLGLPYAGSETIVGIPDNFNGQNVNHNTERSGDAYAALLGGAENMTSEIATASIIPYKKHILEFLTRRPACNNSNTKNFDVTVSLVGTNYSVNVNSEGDLKPNNANTWNRTIRCLDFANGNVPSDIRVVANVGQRVYVDDFFLTQLADAGCNDSICKGDSILIGKPCKIPGANYSWSSLIANSSSILNYPCGTPDCPQVWVKPDSTENFKLTVVGPASETSYLNEIEYYDYFLNDRCTDSDTVEIFVHPLPEFTLEGPQFDCDTAVYTANSVALHVIYTWEPPLGQSYVILNNHQIQINWSAIADSAFVIAFALDTLTGCTYSDTLVIYPCCEGTSGWGFTAIKTSDFLLDVNTNNPSVRPEYANWIAITPVTGNFNSTLSNIRVIFNTAISGSVAFNEPLTVDVRILQVTGSELLFNFKGAIVCEISSFQNVIDIDKQSFLHSCNDKLWRGIFVAGNPAMNDRVSVNLSRIEDAYTAVSSSRCARVNITNSVFNRNRIHINLNDCNNLSTSTITNNQFLSNDPTNPVFGAVPALINSYTNFTGSPGPRHSYITSQAIRLVNVSRVEIRNNQFENAYNALFSRGANFDFSNNEVHNIYERFDPFTQIPTNPLFFTYPTSSPGLFATNASIDNNARGSAVRIHFGLQLSSFFAGYQYVDSCEFRNFFVGVYADNDFNLIKKGTSGFVQSMRSRIMVTHSTFDNATYQLGNSDIAVWLKNIRSRALRIFNSNIYFEQIIVNDNRINNTSNGIKTERTNTLIEIQRNSLNTLATATRRMADGIRIFGNNHQIPVSTLPFPLPNQLVVPPVNITIANNGLGANTTNTVNQLRFGVSLLSSMNSSIRNNSIFSNGGQPGWGLSTNGILLDNASRSTILRNSVWRVNQTFVGTNVNTINGIEIRNSRNVRIHRNDMLNYSAGLLLKGDNGSDANGSQAQIFCNVFDGDFYGIHITNSVFGNQGILINNDFIPQDNSWSNEPNGGRRIFGNLGLPNFLVPEHNFFHRANNNFLNNLVANPPFAPLNLLPNNADLSLGLNQNTTLPNPWNVQVFPISTSFTPFKTMIANNARYCKILDRPTLTISIDSVNALRRDTLFGDLVNLFDPDTISPVNHPADYAAIVDWAINMQNHTQWLTTEDSSRDSVYAQFYNKAIQKDGFKLMDLMQSHTVSATDSVDYFQAYRDNVTDTLAVDALIDLQQSYTDSLMSRLNSINTTFAAHVDLKQMLALLLNNTELTSSDTLWLEGFAYADTLQFDQRQALAQLLLDSIYRPMDIQPRLSAPDTETLGLEIPEVYPNPTHAEFWVKTPTQNAQIKVTDILGHEVFNFTSSEMLTSISTSQWAQGIYLVSITETNGLRSHFKLIKQ